MAGDFRLPIADCRLQQGGVRELRAIGNRQSAIGNRTAFTLLEIILTLSLTLLLMAALYAALKLHLTMAHEGPRTVQRAQLARALLERIARDLRAAIPQPPPAESSTSSTATSTAAAATGAAAAGSGSTSASATNATAETDPYTAAFGILGGTDWIEIYVAQPRPDLDDAETLSLSGSVAQASNVVRVRYALTSLPTQPDEKGQTMRYVIARTAVPAVAAEQFDASSDESDFRAASDILCDDAGHLEFQYWDDTTGAWVESWGTTAALPPPRAVKVIISLLRPDEYLNDQMGLSGGQSTWRPNYQIVVPIATWVPASEEGG